MNTRMIIEELEERGIDVDFELEVIKDVNGEDIVDATVELSYNGEIIGIAREDSLERALAVLLANYTRDVAISREGTFNLYTKLSIFNGER